MNIICKQSVDASTENRTRQISQEEEIIICALCNNHVTDPSRQIIVNNSFHHTFANPYGHVFEIGCFKDAEGCNPASISSTEFPWFTGYSWKIGACSYCSTHLGWIFSSESDQFFGLIIEKLIFP